MVWPHIEYATQVWSPQYKKDKITLENVQRRTTHLVKCIKHLSYSERLKTLGLPTLEHRGPARFLVDLGHISVYFLPNICFFFDRYVSQINQKTRRAPMLWNTRDSADKIQVYKILNDIDKADKDKYSKWHLIHQQGGFP